MSILCWTFFWVLFLKVEVDIRNCFGATCFWKVEIDYGL
jgi:hypothetical protein